MAELWEIGGVPVDPLRVVAIERGPWDNDAQDYWAILVFDAGARVRVASFIGKVTEELRG